MLAPIMIINENHHKFSFTEEETKQIFLLSCISPTIEFWSYKSVREWLRDFNTWTRIAVLTGHAEILGLRGLVATLGAGDAFVLLVLEALPAHVVLTVTRLAAQTRVLAQLVARLTYAHKRTCLASWVFMFWLGVGKFLKKI